MYQVREGEGVKDRLTYIDVIKALCMLYIVAFHHLQEYCTSFPHLEEWIRNFITTAVLGAFSLTSGILSAAGFERSSGTGEFYRKRFIKSYPLFCTAAICLYLLNRISVVGYVWNVRQLFLTITGLSPFFPPMASTVWYMGMIMIFWLVTPMMCRGRDVSRILYTLGIWIAFYLLLTFAGMDSRVFIYFLPYSAGVFSRKCRNGITGSVAKQAVLSAICFVFVMLLCREGLLNELTGQTAAALSGAIAVALVCAAISGLLGTREKRVFKLLNDISMPAYLFHRVVYFLLMTAIGSFSLLTAYFLALPLCLIVSYGIKEINDIVSRKMLKMLSPQ